MSVTTILTISVVQPSEIIFSFPCLKSIKMLAIFPFPAMQIDQFPFSAKQDPPLASARICFWGVWKLKIRKIFFVAQPWWATNFLHKGIYFPVSAPGHYKSFDTCFDWSKITSLINIRETSQFHFFKCLKILL